VAHLFDVNQPQNRAVQRAQPFRNLVGEGASMGTARSLTRLEILAGIIASQEAHVSSDWNA
jgi:hypothetical protein